MIVSGGVTPLAAGQMLDEHAVWCSCERHRLASSVAERAESHRAGTLFRLAGVGGTRHRRFPELWNVAVVVTASLREDCEGIHQPEGRPARPFTQPPCDRSGGRGPWSEAR